MEEQLTILKELGITGAILAPIWAGLVWRITEGLSEPVRQTAPKLLPWLAICIGTVSGPVVVPLLETVVAMAEPLPLLTQLAIGFATGACAGKFHEEKKRLEAKKDFREAVLESDTEHAAREE